MDGSLPDLKPRFLEEAALWGSAVRRRCPRGPAPPPEGHMPQPTNARKGASVGTPACGLVLRGLVGAIGLVVRVSLVRRGCRCGRVLYASLPV